MVATGSLAATTVAGSLTGAATSFFTSVQSVPGLTILYTNDTHSRIDPFPENALEYAGLGGVSRRAAMIRQIRLGSPHTLLLDAGGIFQGSSWFGMYGGERSIELMSMMGYDAVCPGEQEFSNGVEGFLSAARLAEFPFVCANYATSNTELSSLLQEHIVREFNDMRIGVFGLGIRLEGLIAASQFDGVNYQDPVIRAGEVVTTLKEEFQCDYIICLSHLGYRYEDDQIDDRKLASQVAGIDLIIGGHTHTFLGKPEPVVNPDGEQTLVTQVGHSGLRLGRIDLHTDENGSIEAVADRQYSVK